MRIFAFLTVFGLASGAFAPLHGQSLADVAKKEEERRKTAASGTKVYTNGDLKSVDPAPDPITLAADSSAGPEKKSADSSGDSKPDAKADGKTPAKDAKAAAKGEVKDQDYWSAKMLALNQQLDRDRLYAEALQTRINSLTAEFAGKDDPVQRSIVAQDREKALAELERLRKAIEEDKDNVANAEEEARHAGVPR
jgi:hypothetical protein